MKIIFTLMFLTGCCVVNPAARDGPPVIPREEKLADDNSRSLTPCSRVIAQCLTNGTVTLRIIPAIPPIRGDQQ